MLPTILYVFHPIPINAKLVHDGLYDICTRMASLRYILDINEQT